MEVTKVLTAAEMTLTRQHFEEAQDGLALSLCDSHAELAQENSEMKRMLAEPPESAYRIADLTAQLAERDKALAELTPRALFGDECMQDDCEGAFVFSSVHNVALRQLKEERDALRLDASFLRPFMEFCRSLSSMGAVETRRSFDVECGRIWLVLRQMEDRLAGLPSAPAPGMCRPPHRRNPRC